MLKLGLLFLFLSFGFPVLAGPTSICEVVDDSSKLTNAVCMFSKPLLIGASVTQGYKANRGGPAALIAESLSPGAKITNIAVSGAKSVDSLKNHVLPSELPSVVIGVDLFFWDASRNDCDENFEKNTKEFLKKYQDKNIPMILGKLPKGVEFPTGYKLLNTSMCTDKINKLLDEECTPEKNCLIYDPKDCLSKIEPKDRELFFVDRLHSSVEGNKFCAQEFVAANKYSDLRCGNK
jgi:hypothetical protein